MTHRISLSIAFICALSLIVWSCVDVSTTNITTQDYRSLARFYDVAVDTSGSLALTLDGATMGNLSLTQKIDYASVKAGNRTLTFAGTTQPVNFNTDEQSTVFIHPLLKGRRFLNLGEGDSKKNNALYAARANVRFVNLAQGNPLSIREGSATGSAIEASVAYEAASAYDSLTVGPHTFFAVAMGSYLATINGAGAHATVATMSSASGAFDVSLDNGVVYSIADTVDNSHRFYTAANFYMAPPGSNGPAIQAIDVSGQTITFQGASLTSTDSTIAATGTGKFTLTSNATRDSFSLAYTVSATIDSTDTITDGYFHDAAGIVRTFESSDTLTNRTATFDSVWQRSDAQSLTAALVDSLLKGKVYVDFHSKRHPTGLMRAFLMPDSFTVNTFAGQWNDSTLVDSLRQKFAAGKIYVNFLTVANPAGDIRGQLTVDPAKGHYGIASLPTDSTYVAGHMYTIVAAGTGSGLKLFKLADRQVGVSKAAMKLEKPASSSIRTTKSSHK